MEHGYCEKSLPSVDYSPKNWFLLDTKDLGYIMEELLGAGPRHYIRHELKPAYDQEFIVGVDAPHIESELRSLSDDCLRFLGFHNMSSAAILLAASIYHLRFEAIHPLRDGNGRIGRYIMASQCSKFLKNISRKEILLGIEDNKSFYRSLFLAEIPDAERIDILVDILRRTTGVYSDLCTNSADINLYPGHCVRISSCFRFGPC